MRKNVFKKKLFLGFFIFVILILIFSFSLWLKKKFYGLACFKVKKIEFRGNIDEEIKKYIFSSLKGKPIFFKLDSLYKEILKRFPSIKEVRILKKFPSTIVFKIEKREPFLQVRDDYIYVIDEELKIIGKTKGILKETLPVVEVGRLKKEFSLGERLGEERVREAVQFFKVLKKETKFSPQVILAYRLNSLSFVEKGTKFIIGGKDWHKKLEILESILKEKFGNNFEALRYIDLREERIYIGRK